MESDRHYELELTAEPRRLTVVRRIVAAHLRHWKMPDLADLCGLGVTELIANVHRHVGPGAECVLRLTAEANGVRCEVRDGSSVLPRLLDPGDDEVGGRGLALVAAVSEGWGAEADGTGKVVWFSLRSLPVFAALTCPDDLDGLVALRDLEELDAELDRDLAAADLDRQPAPAQSTPVRSAPARTSWPKADPAPAAPGPDPGERARVPVRLRA